MWWRKKADGAKRLPSAARFVTNRSTTCRSSSRDRRCSSVMSASRSATISSQMTRGSNSRPEIRLTSALTTALLRGRTRSIARCAGGRFPSSRVSRYRGESGRPLRRLHQRCSCRAFGEPCRWTWRLTLIDSLTGSQVSRPESRESARNGFDDIGKSGPMNVRPSPSTLVNAPVGCAVAAVISVRCEQQN